MLGRRAGSPIAVYAQVQCESPKQDSKRFNSIVKTINIGYLGIIYLCCTQCTIAASGVTQRTTGKNNVYNFGLQFYEQIVCILSLVKREGKNITFS